MIVGPIVLFSALSDDVGQIQLIFTCHIVLIWLQSRFNCDIGLIQGWVLPDYGYYQITGGVNPCHARRQLVTARISLVRHHLQAESGPVKRARKDM